MEQKTKEKIQWQCNVNTRFEGALLAFTHVSTPWFQFAV